MNAKGNMLEIIKNKLTNLENNLRISRDIQYKITGRKKITWEMKKLQAKINLLKDILKEIEPQVSLAEIEVKSEQKYEVKEGTDGKMKIFIKNYNVAIAEFYENSHSAQVYIKKLLEQ